jgi:arabinosaccharide transport system substrate-binding protein
MMGITKACPNPELALKLMEYLYFSDDGIRAESETTEILPPIKSLWNDPLYHRPDPFFGGQKIEELFTQLAPRIPPRYVTAATPIVNTLLNDAVAHAVNYVEEHGADSGLEPACRGWLAEIAADLRARMKQWRLDS